MIDFGTVNRAALAVLPAILFRLAPGGKVLGREYVVRNPTLAVQGNHSGLTSVF